LGGLAVRELAARESIEQSANSFECPLGRCHNKVGAVVELGHEDGEVERSGRRRAYGRKERQTEGLLSQLVQDVFVAAIQGVETNFLCLLGIFLIL
jgi:hypothetical protein